MGGTVDDSNAAESLYFQFDTYFDRPPHQAGARTTGGKGFTIYVITW